MAGLPTGEIESASMAVLGDHQRISHQVSEYFPNRACHRHSSFAHRYQQYTFAAFKIEFIFACVNPGSGTSEMPSNSITRIRCRQRSPENLQCVAAQIHSEDGKAENSLYDGGNFVCVDFDPIIGPAVQGPTIAVQLCESVTVFGQGARRVIS